MFSFKNEKIAGDITILCMYTKSQNIWGAVPEIQSKTIFCHSGQFFPLYPFNNPQNQIVEKMKEASGEVIILHMCTKNQGYVMYASWDMECDRHNFLSI